MRGSDFQYGVQPITPTVKKLIIINLALWFVLVMIIQNFFLKNNSIYEWFGLVPYKLIGQFWLWQPFSYFFYPLRECVSCGLQYVDALVAGL